MSEQTTNLSLPYILPSQAQKHVTHNEALQRLDATVQLVIADTLALPPAAAAEGEVYAIAPGAAGAWSGKSGWLALRQDGAWTFIQPREGWRAWFAAAAALSVHHDGGWTALPLPPMGAMSMLGLNATADATNRLAVASAATLLSHDGQGHQIKLNKATSADTASLLFQTGWSGRAEIGLAGNDGFSLKVSPDGAVWHSALTVTAAGRVHMPQRPAVSASMNMATVSQADGTRTGFQTLHVDQGGFSLGAAVAGGSGNRLVVPETGLYLLNLALMATAAAGHGMTLIRNGTTPLATLSRPGTSGIAATASIQTIAPLFQGDWLSIGHTGVADVQFGAGKTGLSAVLL